MAGQLWVGGQARNAAPLLVGGDQERDPAGLLFRLELSNHLGAGLVGQVAGKQDLAAEVVGLFVLDGRLFVGRRANEELADFFIQAHALNLAGNGLVLLTACLGSVPRPERSGDGDG